jgi:hypothetical protein
MVLTKWMTHLPVALQEVGVVEQVEEAVMSIEPYNSSPRGTAGTANPHSMSSAKLFRKCWLHEKSLWNMIDNKGKLLLQLHH